jgi:phosphoribosylaminoimidazole-succinocarboxamide synthase
MAETNDVPQIGAQMYEGKAKKVYATSDPALCVVSYKDDATAFNGEKRGQILGKGEVNNRVSNHLMRMLEQHGIPTHLVKELGPRETLVKRVRIVPLEVIVRNIAAGSMAQRLGLDEGRVLPTPVLEYSYKDDALGDPLVNDTYVIALGWATRAELDQIADYAYRVNDLLKADLDAAGIVLVDFKLEFGRLPDGTIILADEISPDTCRFWDKATGAKLDKDRFRRDLGGVEEAYVEVRRRLLGTAA